LDAVSPSKPDSLAALLDLDTQARHAAEHVAGRLAA
jgi:1-deoxy-D-xylulose-5-phosphate reductoisomerase